MKTKRILQQNSTHFAVYSDDKKTIEVWMKGLDLDDLHFPAELLWKILAEDKDDLFAIFERLDEDNRCNVAEFLSAVK
jgi:hypothetical protein